MIVGAGPAGLAAAIRLKQLSPDISVVVVEKGSEVGAHILSGAVIDPDRARPAASRLAQRGHADQDRGHRRPLLLALTAARALRLPNFLMPPLMSNHGNFIVSLGNVCRWLATKAEALGVEIYPGFAAAEVLYDANGAVAGVATGDMGIGKDGKPKDSFTRGMELRAKYTLFAEGARGSLTKTLITRFDLDADREPQKFGIGLKELWQVAPEQAPARPGAAHVRLAARQRDRRRLVPLSLRRQSGVGRLRRASQLRESLSSRRSRNSSASRRIRWCATRSRAASASPMARAPSPRAAISRCRSSSFPGGALIGCAAGFVNVPRIKGSHNAILSGMLAAEHVADALARGRGNDELGCLRGGVADLRHRPRSLEGAQRQAAVVALRHADRHRARRPRHVDATRSASRCSARSATASRTAQTLQPAAEFTPIAYPKPDGKLTFDRLSSVFLSNTNHEEDQPPHLKVADLGLQKSSEHDVYGGPSARYCPAGVYEWVEEGGAPRFVINAQNCVHCKTCDIKDPNQNITWVPPEGGGGPNYPNM